MRTQPGRAVDLFGPALGMIYTARPFPAPLLRGPAGPSQAQPGSVGPSVDCCGPAPGCGALPGPLPGYTARPFPGPLLGPAGSNHAQSDPSVDIVGPPAGIGVRRCVWRSNTNFSMRPAPLSHLSCVRIHRKQEHGRFHCPPTHTNGLMSAPNKATASVFKTWNGGPQPHRHPPGGEGGGGVGDRECLTVSPKKGRLPFEHEPWIKVEAEQREWVARILIR